MGMMLYVPYPTLIHKKPVGRFVSRMPMSRLCMCSCRANLSLVMPSELRHKIRAISFFPILIVKNSGLGQDQSSTFLTCSQPMPWLFALTLQLMTPGLERSKISWKSSIPPTLGSGAGCCTRSLRGRSGNSTLEVVSGIQICWGLDGVLVEPLLPLYICASVYHW